MPTCSFTRNRFLFRIGFIVVCYFVFLLIICYLLLVICKCPDTFMVDLFWPMVCFGCAKVVIIIINKKDGLLLWFCFLNH